MGILMGLITRILLRRTDSTLNIRLSFILDTLCKYLGFLLNDMCLGMGVLCCRNGLRVCLWINPMYMQLLMKQLLVVPMQVYLRGGLANARSEGDRLTCGHWHGSIGNFTCVGRSWRQGKCFRLWRWGSVTSDTSRRG